MIRIRSRARQWAAFALTATMVLTMSPIGDAEEGTEAPQVNYKELKNPQANTAGSIMRGKLTYGRHCTMCHGPDGRSLVNVVADAIDLTQPTEWVSGTTEGEMFRSIRDGVGMEMPPYKKQIKREADLWHLVNFIQSLWPKSIRPDVVEKTVASDEENESEQHQEAEEKQ